MPPTVDFVDESFPAETVGRRPCRRRRAPAAASPQATVTPRFDADPARRRTSLRLALARRSPPQSIEAFDRIAARYEGKTVVETEISPQSREQYRRLAASLHHAQALNGTKVVMVTSALVGEGKTLTAANLALTLSQSYQKQVLLVDADLRRPSLQAVFGIRSGPGLTEGLTSDDERAVPVHQVSRRGSVFCRRAGRRRTRSPR